MVVLDKGDAAVGGAPGQGGDELRGLNRPVTRMEDGAAKVRPQLVELVAPVRVEAVVAQRLVLRLNLDALLRVGRDAQAARAAERPAAERLEAVECVLGPLPEFAGRLGAVGLPRDVVASRGAAEREAAVSTARPAAKRACVVDAYPQAARSERGGAGAAGNPRTDDRDVERAGGPRCHGRRRLVEPEGRGLHTAMLRERSIDPVSLCGKAGQLELCERRRNVRRRQAGCTHELVCGRRQELEQGMRRACPRLNFDPERVEHVARAGQRRRSELEQRIRPLRQRRRDLTRNGKELSSLFEGEVGRDQRAAPLACLDDDRRRAEARDDAVARREAERLRLDAGLVLGDDQRALGDRPRELSVHGRVVAVDAAPEDGYGVPVALERAAVRLAVDAAREAADHYDAGGGEVAAEHARDLPAVRRARPRADDRDRRAGEELPGAVPAQVQPLRRTVDRPQQWRQLAQAVEAHVARSGGVRYASASAMCSGRPSSTSASAAIVRATAATFARPRPDRRKRSTARVNMASAAAARFGRASARRTRADNTRVRTTSDVSPSPAWSSVARGRGTVTTMSKRSSNARERRSR